MTNAISQDADGATPAADYVPGVPNNAPGGNTNAGATNQQQQQVVAYQNTFYTAHLSAPAMVEVAQIINRTVSTAGFKDQAEAYFTFLDDPAYDLRDLKETRHSSLP